MGWHNDSFKVVFSGIAAGGRLYYFRPSSQVNWSEIRPDRTNGEVPDFFIPSPPGVFFASF